MDFKMKLVRKGRDFLEKRSCVLASRAIFLPGNNQRRDMLREEQKANVACEFFENLLDVVLNFRRKQSHSWIIEHSRIERFFRDHCLPGASDSLAWKPCGGFRPRGRSVCRTECL